jgi:hypothetical protein
VSFNLLIRFANECVSFIHVSTACGSGRVLNVDDPPETFGGTDR